MNGKKAKALRKIIYNKSDFRERDYAILEKTGQIINLAQQEEIDTGGKNTRKIPKRRIYKHLKKVTKNVPINKLKNFIFYT